MKILASIFILGFATLAYAGTAEFDSTYFHPAASLYIHGDSTTASNLVANGLSIQPEDGKLLRLKELLDQEQEQDQENKDQDKDQQDQEQQQDQQDQQDQQQEQGQDEQNQDQEQQEDESQQPEPPRAEQMSQDEAESLLDAMKQEEENKRLQLHPVMGAPVKVDKDW